LWLLLAKSYRIPRRKAVIMESPIDIEADFRRRYKIELQKMTYKRLADERYQVNQQAIRTPNRRGELVKSEEIGNEWLRRAQTNSLPRLEK